MKIRLMFLTMAALGSTLPALGNITYSCDPNIDATQAGTCSALNGSTVSGVYSSIFGSTLNANIYIQYGSTGVGESSFNVTPVSYSQYYSALPAYSKSLLPSTDPLAGNTDGNIDVTPALAAYLDLTANGASTAGVEADGVTPCVLGNPGCYDGVITISNGGGFYYPLSPSDPTVPTEVDFYYIVEHETDEILGTSSCIVDPNTNGCSSDPASTDASPADLFRYAAPGVTSFLSTADGSTAYFSINGGVTEIAQYSNGPGLGDYGDWAFNGAVKVQDGEASPGANADLTNDGGSEIAVLNAVGFSAPEPGTMGLFGVGLGILALTRAWRRRRQDD
jgi:hypothetical protein